ncbi:MAG: MarC family protein [Oleiphilaceae bacterium]|nr:MarC family protein [Oleiphilaceae bacterium]
MDLPVFLNAVTALFVIIDPIGTALIFQALMPDGTTRERAFVALKACVISAALLVLFGNYGEGLLASLGISIHALRISGGLLLFYTAFNMITREIRFQRVEGEGDISVFPMSIPLLAGPGSLTVSILLFSNAPAASEQLAVFFAVVLICVLSFVLFTLSRYVKRVIGRTGDEILRRFLGVLLAALAIQFILDGVSGLSALT